MASRRLTKELRETFVRAAMQDVPTPDEELCNKEFEQIIFDHMPPDVKAVFLNDPEWLEGQAIEVDADWNVRHSARDEGLKDIYRQTGNFYLRYKWKLWGEEALPDAAISYINNLKDILTKRVKLMIKLWGIAQGCTTVAQLKEALPDLAKYAPDDTPPAKKNIPVVANLMADVVALGWPGGKIVNAQVVRGAVA